MQHRLAFPHSIVYSGHSGSEMEGFELIPGWRVPLAMVPLVRQSWDAWSATLPGKVACLVLYFLSSVAIAW